VAAVKTRPPSSSQLKDSQLKSENAVPKQGQLKEAQASKQASKLLLHRSAAYKVKIQ
jgi:hypothetical protein